MWLRHGEAAEDGGLMKAKLYYEAHVTVEPVFGERLDQFKAICSHFNFKAANLLMQKRKDDTPERSKHDTFATGHSQTWTDIVCRVTGIVVALRSSGFKVWRYKIEDTLLDSRSQDRLGLLTQDTEAFS